jgi:hypothetical protein
MKKRAILGLGEDAGDKSAHDGTANADERRGPKPHVADLWHEPTSDETDNKADENRPNDVEHGVTFPWGILGDGLPYVTPDNTLDKGMLAMARFFHTSRFM